MKGKPSKRAKMSHEILMQAVRKRKLRSLGGIDFGKTNPINTIGGLSFREASKELGVHLDNFRESTRINDES